MGEYQSIIRVLRGKPGLVWGSVKAWPGGSDIELRPEGWAGKVRVSKWGEGPVAKDSLAVPVIGHDWGWHERGWWTWPRLWKTLSALECLCMATWLGYSTWGESAVNQSYSAVDHDISVHKVGTPVQLWCLHLTTGDHWMPPSPSPSLLKRMERTIRKFCPGSSQRL